MPKLISVTPSSDSDKKLDVKLEQDSGRTKTIRIGQKGADDFTKTRDEEQKDRYLTRHRAREDWTQSGILSSGFWSRWVLWNKPTIKESIADVKKRFDIE
jgi:hypothetical protein